MGVGDLPEPGQRVKMVWGPRLADADGEPDVLSATGGWAVCLSTHQAPRAPGWVLMD